MIFLTIILLKCDLKSVKVLVGSVAEKLDVEVCLSFIIIIFEFLAGCSPNETASSNLPTTL